MKEVTFGRIAVGKVFVFLGIAMLFAGFVSQAQAQAETAKLATEDAPTTSQGDMEIEVGYGFSEANKYFSSSNHLDSRRVSNANEVGAKATYGVTDSLDVHVAYSWADLLDAEEEAHDGQGVGDTDLGLKWNFLSSEDCGLIFAYAPSIILPTGDSGSSSTLGISQDYYSVNQLLVFSYASDVLSVNVDTGYVLPFGEDREDERGQYVFDMAFGYQLTSWLQPEVELNYIHEYESGESDADSLATTAGVIMNVADDWRVDLGAQQVFYGKNADLNTSLIVNISYTFGL